MDPLESRLRAHRLSRANGQDHRKEGIDRIQFRGREFLDAHAADEARAAQGISEARDDQVLSTELFTKEAFARGLGEPPIVGREQPRVDPRQGRNGRKQHSPGLQDAMGMTHRRLKIINILQGLRQNEAVVGIGRNMIGDRQIGDDRRILVLWIDIENVLRPNVASVFPRVDAILDFEDVAGNVAGMGGEEIVDIISIDGCAPIGPVDIAERPRRSGLNPIRGSQLANDRPFDSAQNVHADLNKLRVATTRDLREVERQRRWRAKCPKWAREATSRNTVTPGLTRGDAKVRNGW